MKKLNIPKVAADASDIEVIDSLLASQPAHALDCVNWKVQYPAKPEVSFHMAHNEENILLRYDVREGEILAAITEDNGEVWTDSCVEFFLSFDQGKHYYNIEVNCAGKALIGYRKAGESAIHGSAEVMKLIRRLPSLGTTSRSLEQGDFYWTLTLVIPRQVFWETPIQTFGGLRAMGNFYKCGDNLSAPHFLSWSPIHTLTPSFHQPTFFGELIFE